MGTGDIGLPSLRWLLDWDGGEVVGVFTQPDRPVGRKMILTAPEPKNLALQHGVPVFQPEKLRGSPEMEALKELKPDVIVVMAYGQILSKAVIDLPTIACLNLHASILPRHRGAAPIQAAIRDGDSETGITVMYVDVGLDTGDELLVETCPILSTDTGQTLHDKLAEIAPVALSKALALLEKGEAPRIPQDDSRATHERKLNREHGEIDWTKSAEQLERLIRAYDPWPGTYTLLDGRKLKILPPSVALTGSKEARPGTITVAEGDQLVVACGEGCLRLQEVQLEGRKRLDVRSFLAGSGDAAQVGTVLG